MPAPPLLVRPRLRPPRSQDKKSKDEKRAAKAAKAAAKADKKDSKKRTEDASGDDTSAGAADAPSDMAVEAEPAAELPEGALDRFQMDASVKGALRKQGIEELFPIQARTYDSILKGIDVVGRARTGQGKTLAFALPVIEAMRAESAAAGPARGFREPRVLVLAPTRELAKQVAGEFEKFSSVVRLRTLCVYGGAAYEPQERALREGVDIVIGTPGRMKDHLERGKLKLGSLKFRILDEADEMLNMGFVEDIETILGHKDVPDTVQTLLFSATMPTWVKQIASKFLRQGPSQTTIDLVGNSKAHASSDVRHCAIRFQWANRATVVKDVVSCYGPGDGQVVVFADTKNDASEMSDTLATLGARALHGDVPQGQREVTMAAFRKKQFRVLVATDVAARGLDVNGIELVVQLDPPKVRAAPRGARAALARPRTTLISGFH